MRILVNETTKIEKGGEINMMQENKGFARHIPPHERKAMVSIEFDEQDWSLLSNIFGDEDTASAAAAIICEAPPEIQILAIQLINIIKEVV